MFSLIWLTVFTFLYQKINHKKLTDTINLIIIISSLVLFEAFCINDSNIPYHWLINFIVYVPIAYYLVNSPNQIIKYRFLYLAAYLLFFLHDVFSRSYDYSSSIYGRISIICGALTIFCYIYSLDIQYSWYIHKLSTYSLDLFALHKYWQYLILLLIIHFKFTTAIVIFGIPINIVFLITGILVIFFSVLSIRLLNKTVFKNFIA